MGSLVDNRQLDGGKSAALDGATVASLSTAMREVQRRLRGRSPGGGEVASLWRCYSPSAIQAMAVAETAIREMVAAACASSNLWVFAPLSPLLLLPPTAPRSAAEARASLGLTAGGGNAPSMFPSVSNAGDDRLPNGAAAAAAAWQLWPSAGGQSGLLQRWARGGGSGAGEVARKARARVQAQEEKQ